MIPSLIRKKLATEDIILCAKASYQDPEIIGLMGTFGFDGLWICLEHLRLDPARVYSLLQACALGGMDAIVRVKPANYPELISLLEAGARGIMLPRVRDLDEVREVIEAMKFPPEGRRGYDGVHADGNFGRMAPADYFADANRNTFLMVQIEEPEIIPQLNELAAMPGVDVLFVGPGDLALGLGKIGQPGHPEIQAVLRAVAAACLRHGKVAGIPCLPNEVNQYREMGFRLFNVVSGYRCMLNGLSQTQLELQKAGIQLGRNS